MTAAALITAPTRSHSELAENPSNGLVSIRGELDARQRADARTRARHPTRAIPGPLALDLRGLSFIDATGRAICCAPPPTPAATAAS